MTNPTYISLPLHIGTPPTDLVNVNTQYPVIAWTHLATYNECYQDWVLLSSSKFTEDTHWIDLTSFNVIIMIDLMDIQVNDVTMDGNLYSVIHNDQTVFCYFHDDEHLIESILKYPNFFEAKYEVVPNVNN